MSSSSITGIDINQTIKEHYETKELLGRVFTKCMNDTDKLTLANLTKDQYKELMFLHQLYKELRNTYEIYEKKTILKKKMYQTRDRLRELNELNDEAGEAE